MKHEKIKKLKILTLMKNVVYFFYQNVTEILRNLLLLVISIYYVNYWMKLYENETFSYNRRWQIWTVWNVFLFLSIGYDS